MFLTARLRRHSVKHILISKIEFYARILIKPTTISQNGKKQRQIYTKEGAEV